MGSNELSSGSNDRTYEKDGYIMSWNTHIPYIGLQYDTQHDKVSNEEPIALKEDESKRITSLKDFAAKFNITPTGQGGKFSVKDFDNASANFTKDDAFDFAMILANIYLKRKIGLGWDDMGDVNSLWDYIDEGMTATDLFAAAQDAAKERLRMEGMDGLDEDSLMMRHRAGQRGKIGKMPLGQHSPHSQAALNENYNLSDSSLAQNMNLNPNQIKTLEDIINLMRVDEQWVQQVYPNGYNVNQAILDVTNFFDRTGPALDMIAQKNPMTYANQLKNAIKKKKGF